MSGCLSAERHPLVSVAIHCSGIGAADAVRVGNEAGRSPMVQQVAGTMTSTTTRRDDAPRERAAFQPRLELCGGGHQRGALAIRDVPYLLPASHPSRRRINYPKTNTCTARATASSTCVNTAPTLNPCAPRYDEYTTRTPTVSVKVSPASGTSSETSPTVPGEIGLAHTSDRPSSPKS